MPSQIRLITALSSGGIPINPTYWLVFAFSLTILPTLHAEKIDNRNFAIDTCFPTPHEIQLAEGRTRAYWTKHASRFGAEPRFLAVEISKIFPAEVQDQELKRRLRILWVWTLAVLVVVSVVSIAVTLCLARLFRICTLERQLTPP